MEAVGIGHWWYGKAGEHLQSFARCKVLIAGKKELCSQSIKGRGEKVYMKVCFSILFSAGCQGQTQIWNNLSNSNFSC